MDKWNEICRTQVIIVDEYSMLYEHFMMTMDQVFRCIRVNNAMFRKKPTNLYERPFGGIRMVFCGDNTQLAPHDGTTLIKGYWLKEMKAVRLCLDRTYRQKQGSAFAAMLDQLRMGEVDLDEYGDMIQKMMIHPDDLQYEFERSRKAGENPVMLYSRRDDVERFNDEQTGRLADQTGQDVVHLVPSVNVEFPDGKEPNKDHLEFCKGYVNRVRQMYNNWKSGMQIGKDCTSSHVPVGPMKICVGSQVMMRINHREDIYVNGSMGTVHKIEPNAITVNFGPKSRQQFVVVPRYKFLLDLRDTCSVSYEQFPFTPASAITVHKCQGLTLNKVFCSMKSAFSPGQIYVAFTRVQDPESLVIVGAFDEDSITADKDAVFFESFEELKKEVARRSGPVKRKRIGSPQKELK
jgi:hypothetical protein